MMPLRYLLHPPGCVIHTPSKNSIPDLQGLLNCSGSSKGNSLTNFIKLSGLIATLVLKLQKPLSLLACLPLQPRWTKKTRCPSFTSSGLWRRHFELETTPGNGDGATLTSSSWAHVCNSTNSLAVYPAWLRSRKIYNVLHAKFSLHSRISSSLAHIVNRQFPHTVIYVIQVYFTKSVAFEVIVSNKGFDLLRGHSWPT